MAEAAALQFIGSILSNPEVQKGLFKAAEWIKTKIQEGYYKTYKDRLENDIHNLKEKAKKAKLGQSIKNHGVDILKKVNGKIMQNKRKSACEAEADMIIKRYKDECAREGGGACKDFTEIRRGAKKRCIKRATGAI